MSSGELSSVVAHSYVQIAAITLFYYDYLLTFAAEVSYIWPQPISVNTFLFFLNRYFSAFGNIAGYLLLFANLGNPEENLNFAVYSCGTIVRTREVLLVLGQVAVSAILATRTMALYHSSRAVVFGVLIFGIMMAGITCWTLLTDQRSTFINATVPGCHYILSEQTAIRFAAAWETSAGSDVLAFSLTLIRTLKMRKVHNMAISFTGEGLLDMILRDGSLYFAVMALANLTNIFTFYFAVGTFKGSFSAAASCIASSLCSRLVLNLYKAATPDSTGSKYSTAPMTTVIFTTRIERCISMDDDLSDVESARSGSYR